MTKLWLRIVGWVLIVCSILSPLCFGEYVSNVTNDLSNHYEKGSEIFRGIMIIELGTAVVLFLFSLICGLVLLGIARIIDTLEKAPDKTKVIEHNIAPVSALQ